MGRLKFFIYFILFLISKSVIAQTNIDSVGFRISFPETFHKAFVEAIYFEGIETDKFVIDDLTNYTFLWEGDSIPLIDTLPNAIYEFDVEGTYHIDLTVIKKSPVTNFTYSRTITVTAPDPIEVPNVFTPNGDNANDLFTIFYDGKTNLDITIFSRTGTQVFKTKSPTIVWDGRNSSGLEVTEGVYYYILTSDNPSIKDQKGFIHLYKGKK